MQNKFLIAVISAWVLTLPVLVDSFLIYGPSLALPSLVSTLAILFLIPLRLYPFLLVAIPFAWNQGQAQTVCLILAITSALCARLSLEDSNQKLSWHAIAGTLAGLLLWFGLSRFNTDAMLVFYGPFVSLVLLLALTKIHRGLAPLAMPALILSFCVVPKLEKPDVTGTALQKHFSPDLVIGSPLTPAGLRTLLKSSHKTILIRMPSSPFVMQGEKPDWNPVWNFVRTQIQNRWSVWYAFRGHQSSWLLGASEMKDLRNMLAHPHAQHEQIKSNPSLKQDTTLPGVLATLAHQESSWIEWEQAPKNSLKHVLHQPQRIIEKNRPELSLLHKSPMRLLIREFTTLTGWVPPLEMLIQDAEWLLNDNQIQLAEGLNWLMEAHPNNLWHDRLLRVKILASMGAFMEAVQILAELNQKYPNQGFLQELAFMLGEAEARHVPYRAFDYEPILAILRTLVHQYPQEIKWARLLLLYQRQAQNY